MEIGFRGWDGYHARVEQSIHLDENGLECVCVCWLVHEHLHMCM